MTGTALLMTRLLSAGTLVLTVIFLALAVTYILERYFHNSSERIIAINRFAGKNAFIISFIVSLGAFAGSLIYSEVIGFAPCLLCWYQRVFMYPLPFIFAIGLYKKDENAATYGLVFSIIGGMIAAFHYYGQMINTNVLPCSAVQISCSQRPFVEFGYITIPMMSLSVFALVAILMLMRRMYINSPVSAL